MRYRRFGNSDLVVSEVGFGTWTLVSDWWGRSDDPHAMITRRARRRDQLHRHRARVRQRRRGRDDPRDVPRRPRRHRAHHQVRLRHQGRAQVPRPVGATARLATRVGPRSSAKTRCAGSAPTASTSTSCTTRASSRSSPTTSGRRSLDLKHEGKVRELGVALGPAIGWVEEGNRADRRPPDRLAADRVQRARAGAGLDVRRAAARVQNGEVEPDLACAARIRHAVGQGHARHRVRPEGPPLAPQPRQHARQLREGRDARRSCGRRRPAARSGRPRSRRSSPTPRSRPCCRRVLTVDDVREYAAAVRPAAHRPTSTDGRRAVVAQLRPRRPLRHAAEVERLGHSLAPMRLPADQRRQQLLDVAREVFAERGLPRHVDGRHRGGRRRHQAGALPALPEQARRCTSSCSTTPAASCSTRSRRRRTATTSGPRAGREPASSPTSGSSPTAGPAFRLLFGASIRTDPEFAAVVDSGRAGRGRRHLGPDRDPGVPTSSGACSRTRWSAWPSRSAGTRPTIPTRRSTPTPRIWRGGSPSWRGSGCAACGPRHRHSFRSRTRVHAVVRRPSRARGARALRRLDVLAQVHRVDLAPDRSAERARVVLGVLREEVEERLADRAAPSRAGSTSRSRYQFSMSLDRRRRRRS